MGGFFGPAYSVENIRNVESALWWLAHVANCLLLLRKIQAFCFEFGKLLQLKNVLCLVSEQKTLLVWNSFSYWGYIHVHTVIKPALFCIWLLQWRDLWSSSLLSVSFSNKFGILCWFQTYLKELGSLKEERSCWPGEKLAWIEEKDSEKGDLSYHTLWQRRDAGQCGCIPRLPAACVISGLIEGS